MKQLIILISLLVAATSLPAQAFEGMYKMVLTQGRDTLPMTIWTKDNHLRMEVQSKQSPGVMVMREGMQEMLIILPQQRMYMAMDIPDVGSRKSADSGEGEEFPFEKTGESKKILGYEAHEFVTEADGQKIVIWATEELGSMPFVRNMMMEGWSGMMKKMTGLNSFFPLEMVGYENGKKEYTMEVKAVEPKELADALFEEPEGYTRMAMPGGFPGMGRR